MPMFRCDRCGCAENTALGAYWGRKVMDKLPPLCSECETGEWHGRFPKVPFDEQKHGRAA